ncbi:MAG: hypothetical protein Q7R40_07460 [Phaeospirillum sp.]|nr:hypothetical protein [Phaeospirillum sp.]
MMISHSVTPGKHIGHHHSAPRHRHESGGGSHKVLVIVALIAVVAAFSIAAFLLSPKEQEESATPEAFVEQIERAAKGIVVERNVFGGAMMVEHKGSQVAVTASNVPPNICVSVGWKLVRKGILTINGTTPLRVSAAKLSELCNQEEGNATLTWSPKTVD